jgi:hypothetical protein
MCEKSCDTKCCDDIAKRTALLSSGLQATKAQDGRAIPQLELDDVVGDRAVKREAPLPSPDEVSSAKAKKPAILAAAVTIGSVTMLHRARPAPKPAIIQMPRGREPVKSAARRWHTAFFLSVMLLSWVPLPICLKLVAC